MATTINANHRKAFEHLLETKGTEQFRRSDLAKTIYPLTNPRSRERSEDIATALIHEAAQGGRLQRRGHLHWVRVESGRTLKSGRTVPELDKLIDLTITTRCTGKWACVDLETGEVWVPDAAGRWKRPDQAALAEVKTALSKTNS